MFETRFLNGLSVPLRTSTRLLPTVCCCLTLTACALLPRHGQPITLEILTYNVWGYNPQFKEHDPRFGEAGARGIARLVCSSEADLVGIQEDYWTFGWSDFNRQCSITTDPTCQLTSELLNAALEEQCPGAYERGFQWDEVEGSYTYDSGATKGGRAITRHERDGVESRSNLATNTIYWRKDRFSQMDSGVIPLCLEPDIEDRDACRRAVTTDGKELGQDRLLRWAQLCDRRVGHSLYVYNTHLQHRGEDYRLQQVSRIIEEISSRPEPYILIGDLNSTTSIPDILLDYGMRQAAAPGSLDHILLSPGLATSEEYQSANEIWRSETFCPEAVGLSRGSLRRYGGYKRATCSDHFSRSAVVMYERLARGRKAFKIGDRRERIPCSLLHTPTDQKKTFEGGGDR